VPPLPECPVSPREWVSDALGYVLSTAVVSAQTEKVVKFFLERTAAEAMIEEVVDPRC
jgi:hypothetical protein